MENLRPGREKMLPDDCKDWRGIKIELLKIILLNSGG